MTTSNLTELLNQVPPSLAEKITSIVQQHPHTAQVFEDFYSHLCPQSVSPNSKKRKIEFQDSSMDSNIAETLETPLNVVATISNLSVLVPLRKKLSLELCDKMILIHFEKKLIYQLKYNDIGHVFKVNTPQKTKPHWTLCLILKRESGLLSDKTLLFGWDEKVQIESTLKVVGVYETIMHCINQADKPVVLIPALFPKIKWKPIDCHYKAKEGSLFFFNEGLVFGVLKKPLFFFPQETFSIKICDVTGRTFNVVVEIDDQVTEFGMIDAGDYPLIAAYLQKISQNQKPEEIDSEVSTQSKNDGQIKNGEVEDVANSEEDDDFIAHQSSEVDEEYDEDYNTDEALDATSVSIHSNDSDRSEDDEEDGVLEEFLETDECEESKASNERRRHQLITQSNNLSQRDLTSNEEDLPVDVVSNGSLEPQDGFNDENDEIDELE